MALPRGSPLSPARPEEILRPAAAWFVLLTLALGFVGNLLPFAGVADVLRPDFLALLLLYWCIQAPRYVGVGTAWLLGLCAVIVLLIRVVGGAPLPRWTYVVPPLSGALLWPAISVLLQWPQRPVTSQSEL